MKLSLIKLLNLSILTIGVCSYLLIGYWSHRLAAVKSAQKAILVNRVSDGMLLWGVLWIWYNTGTLEYDLINLNSMPGSSMFLGVAIMIGAMGKSAQILFHVWLADAMEGGLFKLISKMLVFFLFSSVFYVCLIDGLNLFSCPREKDWPGQPGQLFLLQRHSRPTNS